MSSRRFASFGFVLSVAAMLAAPALALDSALAAAVKTLPADANLVLYCDFSDLKGSPLFEKIRAQSHAFEAMQREMEPFIRETGLDPQKDIDGALLAAVAEKGGKTERVVILLTGRFVRERLTAVLAKQGVRSEEYRKHVIYEPEQKGGGDVGGVVLMDEQRIALGEATYLRKHLDVVDGMAQGLASNQEMMDRVRRVKQQGQIWGVVQTDLLGEALPANLEAMDPSVASAIRPLTRLKYLLYSAFVGRDVELKVELAAATGEDARNVADVFRGLAALGKLALSEKEPELASTLQGIEIDQDSEIVSVSMVLREPLLDRLMKQKGETSIAPP